MRQIYSTAYAVLVKNSSLESFRLSTCMSNPNLGVVEPGARIFLSPWMRRIWTLQESVLAGLPTHDAPGIDCFAFEDCCLSLEPIIGMFKMAPKRAAEFTLEY